MPPKPQKPQRKPAAKKRGRKDLLWVGELEIEGSLFLLISKRKPAMPPLSLPGKGPAIPKP